MGRGQTSLPALAVALLVLTVVAGLGLAMADGAITGAEDGAGQYHAALALSDRLVAPDGPASARPNVLDATAVDGLNASDLRATAPSIAERDVRVTLGGRVIARRGEPTGGTTIRRLVLLERHQDRTLRPAVAPGGTVTVPRRVARATVTLDPPDGVTVWTVRADGRVVLRNQSGLDGTFVIRLSPRETTSLRFESSRRLPGGSVTVRYDAVETTKATLAVTVDG